MGALGEVHLWHRVHESGRRPAARSATRSSGNEGSRHEDVRSRSVGTGAAGRRSNASPKAHSAPAYVKAGSHHWA